MSMPPIPRDRPVTGIEVLFIEDDLVDEMALIKAVADQHLPYRMTIARSVTQARTILAARSFDIIITDYSLGDGTAFDLFEQFSGQLVIFTTGSGDEEVAALALQMGVNDYLIKDQQRGYLKLFALRVEAALHQSNMARQLRESEQRYRIMIEWSPEAISVHRDGKIVYVNPAAIHLFGATSAQDLVGKPVLDLAHPDFRQIALERIKCVTGQGLASPLIEQTFLKLDGTQIEVEVRDTLIAYDGEPAIHMVARDITQRRKAEAELEQHRHHLEEMVFLRTAELEAASRAAEAANRAKSEFLSSVSHELRTPLNAVLGYAELFANDPDLSPEKQENAREIERAGQALLSLVSEVLDLSRIESGRMELALEPCTVKSIIDGSLLGVSFTAREAGIKLIDDGGDGQGATVMADPARLIQVVLSLLTNAIKYNRPNGRVHLSCVYSCTRTSDTIRITVTDTGLGIPLGKQSRIFSAFDRLGYENGTIKGTGIGLSIARKIIGAMGGTLGFTSVEGQGSTFWAEIEALPASRITPR